MNAVVVIIHVIQQSVIIEQSIVINLDRRMEKTLVDQGPGIASESQIHGTVTKANQNLSYQTLYIHTLALKTCH